jgi:hypothetical protein
MSMKYPNVLYTALLATVLLVPFAISYVAPTLEPYPAVLLPSWAGTIKVANDRLDFDRTTIYGKVIGLERWTRLLPLRFLKPLSPEFFPPLAQRCFGLSPVGPISNRTKLGAVITLDSPKVSEVELRNAKAWLRTRLSESGCDGNVLRITREVVTIRRSDGAEIEDRYRNDRVFDLR